MVVVLQEGRGEGEGRGRRRIVVAVSQAEKPEWEEQLPGTGGGWVKPRVNLPCIFGVTASSSVWLKLGPRKE